MRLVEAGLLRGFVLVFVLVFVRGRFLFFTPGPKQLPEGVGDPPNPELLKKPVLGPLNREWIIYALGILGVGAVFFLVQREPVVNTALTIASGLMLLFFIYYMIRKCTWAESQRLILALVLSILFSYVWKVFPLTTTVRGAPWSWELIGSIVYHSFLPAVSIIAVTFGWWMLSMRALSSTLMDEDFVVYARLKGLARSTFP